MALKDSIVAYYKVDENTGTTMADSVRTSPDVIPDGTLKGTTIPVWEAGKINYALNYQGGTLGSVSSYVSLPVTSSFTFGTGDFTISFWVNHNNTSSNITFWDSGYDQAAGVLIEYRTIATTRFNIYTNGGAADTFNTTLNANTWYHVVVRRISTTLEVFVNASSLGTVSNSENLGNSNNLVYIGRYAGVTGIENLNGLIDELGIWKGKGLSNTEITTLYNNGNGLQYPFGGGNFFKLLRR